MLSLFEVNVDSTEVDPDYLDTDSKEVYLDPNFRHLIELPDGEIVEMTRETLTNKHSLVVDRLPAILFLLNTPASCRVLIRADFESLQSLFFSSWRPSDSTRWAPTDKYLEAVLSKPPFKTLMFLDEDVLAREMNSIGVDSTHISRLAAILLLLNTTSSWVLLGNADHDSIISAVQSEYATERRINTLKQELDRLDRHIGLPTDIGEDSVAHLPIELIRQIVLNTHDIARLSELQKISSIYARVLDEPEILQHQVSWWMENGVPFDEYRGLEDVDIRSFKELRQWVIDNFYSSLCYTGENKNKCIQKAVEDNDIEAWEDIERDVSLIDIVDAVSSVSELSRYDRRNTYWSIVKNNGRRIAQYFINNKIAILDMIRNVDPQYATQDQVNMLFVLVIAFGTANDLVELINYGRGEKHNEENRKLLYFLETTRNGIYKYLLLRSDYNRGITRILLDNLIRDDIHHRAIYDEMPKEWIPQLIEDLENGYYPEYPNTSWVWTRRGSQTNYWINLPRGGWAPQSQTDARIALIDYLRDMTT